MEKNKNNLKSYKKKSAHDHFFLLFSALLLEICFFSSPQGEKLTRELPPERKERCVSVPQSSQVQLLWLEKAGRI